jgi:hypothetical protein
MTRGMTKAEVMGFASLRKPELAVPRGPANSTFMLNPIDDFFLILRSISFPS